MSVTTVPPSCSPTTSSASGSPRSVVLDQLNDEWSAISDSIEARARVRRWCDLAPALRGCVTLDDVRRRVSASAPAEQDFVLGFLLREGKGGDRLAHRTVFQAFLGAAIKLGFSPSRHMFASRDAIGQDVAVALWDAVASYPLDRRPAKIPANLKMEVVHRLSSVHSARGTSRPDRPLPNLRSLPPECQFPGSVTSEMEWELRRVGTGSGPRWVSITSGSPTASDSAPTALLEVMAWGIDIGAISTDQAALLIRVYCPPPGSPGGRAVAEELGLSWAAVRQRCSRAVRALAAAVGESMAAGEASFDSLTERTEGLGLLGATLRSPRASL